MKRTWAFLIVLVIILLTAINVFAGEEELTRVNFDVYNSHTYAVYYTTATWEEAREWCEANGGHLAVITDEREQSFIESLNNNGTNLWIGAYREFGNDWKWVTGEEWSYTNWAEGEPNDSNNVVPDENCVTLWPAEWNDLNSENVYEQYGFICEWDSDDVIPPEGDKDDVGDRYYFDVYVEDEIVLRVGDMYEIYIDTNSPLEVPYELISCNTEVFEAFENCIVATGEGEGELLICDYYGSVTYSYRVTVQAVPDEGGNKGEYNSHTYAVYRCSVRWETAKDWCEANGGHLAVITDEREQEFIEALNNNGTNLWIGAYREFGNEWKWVTEEEWSYTNWATGEPNDSDNVVPDENCVTLWPMAWNDLNNKNVYEQNGFICEWEYVNDAVPEEAPHDDAPSGDTEDKPNDGTVIDPGEVETKPAPEVEMTVTTTLKEPEVPGEEAEVIVHIELEELTEGNVEDTTIFIRATSDNGEESIQSRDGGASLEVGVPASKKKVKVFCFESLTTLKPLCEAKVIEIEY